MNGKIREGWIDLARAPDFMLGALRVRPANCEIEVDGHRRRLEPRVMQVLVALALADGEAVSRDALNETCWGGRVVGDDAVNRCIQRLRRLLEGEAAGDFVIETLPRVGYRLTRRTPAPSPALRPPPAPPRPPGRRLGRLAATLALFAAAALVWLAFARLPAAPEKPPTVAVERLATDAAAPTHQVAMELQARLAGVAAAPGLSVLNPKAGTKADYQISGLAASDPIAVELRLADRRGVVLWSANSKARGSEGLDPLIDRAVAPVAEVMRCLARSRARGAGAVSEDALSLFLTACAARADPVPDPAAIDQLQQAVALSPNFAPARAALAWELSRPDGAGGDSATEAETQARSALRLDRRQGDAYRALAALAGARGDRVKSHRLLLEGVAADPDDADLYVDLGDEAASQGHLRRSLPFYRQALALAPASPEMGARYAYALDGAGATSEAADRIQRLARLYPGNDAVRYVRFKLAAWNGREAEAEALLGDPAFLAARPLGALDADGEIWREALNAHRARDPVLAGRVKGKVLASLPRSDRETYAALTLLAYLGYADDAFELAARMPSVPPAVAADWMFRQPLATMRRDPRFLRLAARLGLVNLWRTTGDWPDFCGDPKLPYACRGASPAGTAPTRSG